MNLTQTYRRYPGPSRFSYELPAGRGSSNWNRARKHPPRGGCAMLLMAVASWVLAGVVGFIANLAASAASSDLDEENSAYLALSANERLARSQRRMQRIRTITLNFAGATYGLVFFLWWGFQNCTRIPGDFEYHCGGTGWSFLFLLIGGLLLGRRLLERIMGLHRKPGTT